MRSLSTMAKQNPRIPVDGAQPRLGSQLEVMKTLMIAIGVIAVGVHLLLFLAMVYVRRAQARSPKAQEIPMHEEPRETSIHEEPQEEIKWDRPAGRQSGLFSAYGRTSQNPDADAVSTPEKWPGHTVEFPGADPLYIAFSRSDFQALASFLKVTSFRHQGIQSVIDLKVVRVSPASALCLRRFIY